MLIGQKVTKIHAFRVASFTDAHTTVVDLKKVDVSLCVQPSEN